MILLRGETYHTSDYDHMALNFNILKIIPLKVELRGGNTARSCSHMWLRRFCSVWFDWGQAPQPGKYRTIVWFENAWHGKYYESLILQHTKKVITPSHRGQLWRRAHVYIYMQMPIQIEIWISDGGDAKYLRRRCIRAIVIDHGPFQPTLFDLTRATDGLFDLTIVAKKDITYQNWDRFTSLHYSMLLNCIKGKIDIVTCEVDDRITWKIKPCPLDIQTERHGMNNVHL